ncbi:MAG: DUF4290 domain-containing protein, partial [Alistipes sp.]|nr:DUF4290 domain-containing protein [Alistipes sp.]
VCRACRLGLLRAPPPPPRIPYKHYGKYVGAVIRKLASETDEAAVARTIDNIARYMRTKSFEYNQEHPNNEVIIKDIKNMSEGNISLDEASLNNLRSDYKQHFSARSQKGPQKGQARQQQKDYRKGGQHQQKNYQKNAQYRNSTKQ